MPSDRLEKLQSQGLLGNRAQNGNYRIECIYASLGPTTTDRLVGKLGQCPRLVTRRDC